MVILRDKPSCKDSLMVVALFTAAMALYIPTMAPGLLWGGGDFATFQLKAYLLEIEIPSGIFGHPLWVILAHPFTWLPIRDVAWRANFASAVFAAIALVLGFFTARRLSRSIPASLLAVAALAVSHTFWTYYAGMAKVYSLNALLLIACIYLLLRWGESGRSAYLYIFAFLYGLSLLNHLVMATAAAGFLAYIGIISWHRREAGLSRQLVIAGLAWVLGVSPYLYLLSQTGTAGGVLNTILGFLRGVGYILVDPSALLLGLGAGLALFLYQFPVTFLPGFLGLRRLAREARPEAWMLGLTALGNVLFLLAAADPRAGGEYWWNLHYYLQTYVIFALWIAVGFASLWPLLSSRKVWMLSVVILTVALPILLYAPAPGVVRLFVSNLPGFRPLSGRDNLVYVLSPWKHR